MCGCVSQSACNYFLSVYLIQTERKRQTERERVQRNKMSREQRGRHTDSGELEGERAESERGGTVPNSFCGLCEAQIVSFSGKVETQHPPQEVWLPGESGRKEEKHNDGAREGRKGAERETGE
ncbi:hypothetical protein ABG768_023373 [Culter alburnus]|uniref:Uncharacterized protein n=1 Tax=Culter alburnus TaxID=194366 RepID=A0AAW2ANM7_CULAL